MSVKIRLARAGRKKRPFYHIVAANASSPRDGRFIQRIGFYNPLLNSSVQDKVQVDMEKLKHWLGVGAQPTAVVKRLIEKLGAN